MNILTKIVSDEIPLDENGFHWRSRGKKGTIYFVENGRLMAILTEVPSNTEEFDILVYGKLNHLQFWQFPDPEEVSSYKSEEIQQKLVKWLKARRWRHSFMG